jgi:hypothetical protein
MNNIANYFKPTRQQDVPHVSAVNDVCLHEYWPHQYLSSTQLTFGWRQYSGCPLCTISCLYIARVGKRVGLRASPLSLVESLFWRRNLFVNFFIKRRVRLMNLSMRRMLCTNSLMRRNLLRNFLIRSRFHLTYALSCDLLTLKQEAIGSWRVVDPVHKQKHEMGWGVQNVSSLLQMSLLPITQQALMLETSSRCSNH